MKKSVVVVAIGLIAAFCAFAVALRFPRSASLSRAPVPELAWLKKEFKLSDTEFGKIEALHNSYMPRCEGMCRSIDRKSEEIRQLLAHTNTLTPEIRQRLKESADLRFECDEMMLQHFLDVANSMPRQQGKRYLLWAIENTIVPHSKQHETGLKAPAGK